MITYIVDAGIAGSSLFDFFVELSTMLDAIDAIIVVLGGSPAMIHDTMDTAIIAAVPAMLLLLL